MSWAGPVGPTRWHLTTIGIRFLGSAEKLRPTSPLSVSRDRRTLLPPLRDPPRPAPPTDRRRDPSTPGDRVRRLGFHAWPTWSAGGADWSDPLRGRSFSP
jgi:hypothetical protein